MGVESEDTQVESIPGLPAGLVEPVLRTLLSAAEVGFAVLDRDLRFITVNARLAEINGRSASEHRGRRLRDVVPDLAETVEASFRRVLETGEPLRELELSGEVPGSPGKVRHWLESAYPVPGENGRPVAVAVVVWEITARAEAQRERDVLIAAQAAAMRRAERAAVLQRLLQRLTSALAQAVTTGAVADTTVSVLSDALGADAATLCQYDGDETLTMLAVRGMPEVAARGAWSLRLDDVPFARQTLHHARPVVITSSADRDRRFPELAGRPSNQQAWVNLPLIVKGEPVGFVSFGWARPRAFTTGEIELLRAVAAQCAVALDRARLYEDERVSRRIAERAQHRLDLLARASAALSRNLDERAVLDQLARVVLEAGAAWTAVLLVDGSGNLAFRMSAAGLPALSDLARAALESPGVPVTSSCPAARAFRTGEAQVADVGSVLVAHGVAAVPPGVAPGPAAVPPGVAPGSAAVPPMPDGGTAILVPVRARKGPIGVLLVAYQRDEAWGRVPAADLDTFTDLAHRVGIALDNARLYADQARVARQLQDNLLPDALPTIPGIDLAAHYFTAEEAEDVGGDFYDIFALDSGRWAVVIGDVTGRGIEAAGTTSLARHTLRALNHQLRPAEALHRLNDLLHGPPVAKHFLTAAYAHLENGPDGVLRLTLTRAGHPPPLAVRPDGTYTFIEPPGTILGAFRSVSLAETEYLLQPGDTLVFYTDGATETCGEDGMFGEERLAAAAVSTAGGPADATASAIIAALDDYRSGSSSDDLALFILHLKPGGPRVSRPRLGPGGGRSR